MTKMLLAKCLTLVALLCLSIVWTLPTWADGADKGDGQPAKGEAVDGYAVKVVTGYADGAGTDADVFITIRGDWTSTGELKLDHSFVNDHEEGKLNVYQFRIADVGNVQSIRLRHNNRGDRPGWFVDMVVVKRLRTGQLWYFPVARWLADDACDRQIDINLWPNFRPSCSIF